MYKVSLSSCRAKLNRAEESRRALEDHIESVFGDESKRAILRADADGDTGYHILSLQTVPDLAREVEVVSVRLGEIVHNARSALDHLVWQLACLNTDGNPRWERRVQFPIEDSPATFNDRCTSGSRFAWLGEVRAEHQTMIEKFQPYHGTDNDAGPSRQWFGGYVHEFALLRDLSDRDKHRTLVVIQLPTTSFYLDVRLRHTKDGSSTDWRFATDHALEIGAKVMRAQLDPGALQPDIQPHMDSVGYARPDIALERGGPVVAEMNRVIQLAVVLTDSFESILQ